ncbi:MAG: hypothetical protein QXU09_00245 [Thermoproteota archaeon]|nr:hypothetical protein [Candidatus Brockarchaeota archaeon]
MKRLLFLTILFFLIFPQLIAIRLRPEPEWLKPGFYVEYFVDSTSIGLWLLPNSSLYNSLPNLTGLGEITRMGLYPCNGTYRFELIDMNATFARFNISLDLNAWRPHKRLIMPGEKIIWIPFKMLQTSLICDVELETLATYKDGKFIGIFPLWRSFTSQRNRTILLLNFLGERVDANYIFLERLVPFETPLGTFRYVFVVNAEIVLSLPYVNSPCILITNSVYERDSSLLVFGGMYMDDILLENGILCFDWIKIKETTVEFPQLKEEEGSSFVQGVHFFLALLFMGAALPFLYKLLTRFRIVKRLV